MIRKKIYTAWFSLDHRVPEHIQRYVETQKIEGYEHELITLDTIYKNKELHEREYVRQCLNSLHPIKKFVKLTDYVRMWYLYNEGGIFLDADFEILKDKNFDKYLDNQMFIGKELSDPVNGLTVLGVAAIGAEAKHPLIRKWMDEVEEHFRGDTEDCYESSMHVINLIGPDYQDKMTLLEPDVFYPYDHNTETVRFSSNTIGIHHFNRTWAVKNTLHTFKDNIENGVNFGFVKRGDGELACMNGEVGANCDGHNYSAKLGKGLKDAFEYLKDKIQIVEFADQAEYNILLHRTDNNLEQLVSFYNSIKNSNRKKILIAPRRLEKISKLLRAEFVEIPEVNAFDQYDFIMDNIPIVKNAIYLFCAGMPAKLMIADLHKKNEATYLDCGSAFDCSVYQSRTYQITKEKFDLLYWEDNYKHAQETHPERLFAISNIDDDSPVILDLGCGTNKTLSHAIGVDVRPVSDIQGSIDDLRRFEDESVDCIISRHSFEHLLDPAKAIREWSRVLKREGKIIMVLPDHANIDTLDHYYGKGEHFHAYTQETLKSFVELIPELVVVKSETVIFNWSFGIVIKKLPKIKIVVPTLGRPEGLQKCLASIKKSDYPQHLIDTLVIDGEGTVPQKVQTGLEHSEGCKYLCYAANDMVFDKSCLREAVRCAMSENKWLISFNEGRLLEDNGNICTHFIFDLDAVEYLENEQIFNLEFNHVGCDNYLWAQIERYKKAKWCEKAKITHNHFSKSGEYDQIYDKGWQHAEADRQLLQKKLSELYN